MSEGSEQSRIRQLLYDMIDTVSFELSQPSAVELMLLHDVRTRLVEAKKRLDAVEGLQY